MSKIVRLQENDLRLLVKRIILEQNGNLKTVAEFLNYALMGTPLGPLTMALSRIQSSKEKLLTSEWDKYLDNDSAEHLTLDFRIFEDDFDQILSAGLGFVVQNVSDSETTYIVNELDFPVYESNKQNVLNYCNGRSNFSKNPLAMRAHKVGSNYYPAVDLLRQKYNKDESGILWGTVAKENFGEKLGDYGLRSCFLNCYATWFTKIVTFSYNRIINK